MTAPHPVLSRQAEVVDPCDPKTVALAADLLFLDRVPGAHAVHPRKVYQ